MRVTIWLFIFAFALFTAFQYAPESLIEEDITESDLVAEVLIALGGEPQKHQGTFTAEQIRQGEELVKEGRSIGPHGRRTQYISKHYVCTSCHNLEIEDPDLTKSDPETRLPYVKAKGIPFLQGTTFKGIVNRESWYNDDYVKKYGDEKIELAHENLRESIQLCAIECSQGREMKDWEIEAVLAYYWDLQFDMNDIAFSEQDLAKLNREKNDLAKREELITWIKSFYLQGSPAHFYDSPADKKAGYSDYVGNAENGKDLYELSCLHCHKPDGVSHYVLDNNKLSFKDMKRTIPKNSHFSLYQIIPYGTYAIPGHKPYMPHYPLERMNMQQVEDLRAYVELKAK
ncbi:cytochrome c [Saprospiraceae bacterium]|nr:cytochrome c [Saprospiraceae bacterium]